MPASTVTERAPYVPEVRRSGRLDAVLGHPAAFVATASILLMLFGWTFVAHPNRPAPTKDPAYYTWRTEDLLSEKPATLLQLRGAFDMFAGGYRVAAPVLGGLLRRVAGVSSLNTVAVLMVAAPVLAALLLAGFAFRQRGDPLIFHTVAFGSASLFLTPPFVGYLDNMLCLVFLAAALWFIGPAATSWAARTGLFVMLLLAGFTHPTTLVIFFVMLAAMAVARLVFRKLDLRSVVRDDGPMLLTGFAAVVTTYVLWKVGIWGESASLAEAALPPPYGASFFVDRLVDWVKTMRPALNGPLFLIGVIGLVAMGRRWVEDELGRVSIVWLAPLAGVFGFVAGISYPYYRFFNTTLAWVLLVGVGAFFLIRFVADRAHGSTMFRFVAIAVTAAIALIFATNFTTGFEASKWNDPAKGWLSADERRDLDALRAQLSQSKSERPVVFVIDQTPASFAVWGFTKLSGNTSRYGLPLGQIDQGYLYLGSLNNYVQDRPTLREDETYDKLSRALLDDTRAGIDRAGRRPLVVVASIFNATGANVDIARGRAQIALPDDQDVWALHEGRIYLLAGSKPPAAVQDLSYVSGGLPHIALVIGAIFLLLVPGALALRWFVPRAGAAEALGMVPALSMAMLAVVGIAVLAVAASPLSVGVAWLTVVLAAAIGAVLAAAAWRAGHFGARRPAQAQV